MSLLLIAPGRELDPLKEELTARDPNLEVEIWPGVKQKERVQMAVCWNHPEGVLGELPNLKIASSLGAGADHLLNDPDLPEEVTVSRVVAPSLVRQMKEYVACAVLNFQRNIFTYLRQKREGRWQPHPNTPARAIPVGVMGLGALGEPVARYLSTLGYSVRGWSASRKRIKGVECYAGEDEREEFLDNTRALVCLLPLTDRTRGILNLDLFKMLIRPSYIINVARGEHLVDEDLVYAIEKEWVGGAFLDVFAEEPLPDKHPFWNRREIMVTPHVASITPPDEAADQIMENYKRVLSGMEPIHGVDRQKGY